MSLIWQNVSFSGTDSISDNIIRGCCCGFCSPRDKSKILDQLNGKVNFGELTAMMGPSGAGKSTLLKFITQGKNYRGCDGHLLVDCNEKIRASFITQDEKDHLLLNLTVYESLWYAAEIKNPKSTIRNRSDDIVDCVLDELELQLIRNNLAEKCSGGEKKRLAIALELMSEEKPNFLILDEPTSGLDSYSCFNVVYQLKKLAEAHKMVIITTIHQPSYDMFDLFHKVYIISKAGKCIFSGPPGDIKDYLANYNFNSPANANPADCIVKIASSVHRDDSDTVTIQEEPMNEFELKRRFVQKANLDELERNKLICEKMTIDVKSNWEKIDSFQTKAIDHDGLCQNKFRFNFKILWTLLKRSCRTTILKQRKLILIRFALHAIVAMVLSALYNTDVGQNDGCFIKSGPNFIQDTVNDIKNESVTTQNVKFQFFSMLFLMFAALMPTVLTFPSEIKLFLNEHRNGWYTTESYYLAKTLVEIPCQLTFPFCYTYFLYWYTGQIGMDHFYEGIFGFMSWRYSYFLWITVLCCFIAQGLGFLIGILCVRSFNVTVILSSSILLFLFLFSGFFVKVTQMGSYVEWMTCLSFIRFGFESLLVVIYGFKRCQFLPDVALDYVKVPANSVVLYIFDLEDSDLRKNVIWLFGHLIVTRLVAYILLKNLAEPGFLGVRLRKLVYQCVSTASNTLSLFKPFCLKLGTMINYVVIVLFIVIIIQILVGVVILISNKVK